MQNQMQEKEIWGVLTQEDLGEIRKVAQEKLGESVKKRRFVVTYWNPDYDKNLDTRIRITNGYCEIVQKYGDWENSEILDLKEIAMPISNNIEDLLKLIEILDNAHPKARRKIIQFENEIYKSDKVELKLTKQIGRVVKFNFELELLDESADLLSLAEEYGLRDKITKTDVEFWNKWNKETGTYVDEFTQNQLKEIISAYL